MAKLQIPITDSLMQNAKIYAATNNKTLKEVVTLALIYYIGKDHGTNDNTSITTNTDNPLQKLSDAAIERRIPKDTQKSIDKPTKSDKLEVKEPEPIKEEEKKELPLIQTINGVKYYETGRVGPSGYTVKLIKGTDFEGHDYEYEEDCPTVDPWTNKVLEQKQEVPK